MKAKLIKVYSPNLYKDDYGEYSENSLTDWEEITGKQLVNLKDWVELKNKITSDEKYTILIDYEIEQAIPKALKDYVILAKEELEKEKEKQRIRNESAKKRAETAKKKKLKKLAEEVEELAKSQSKSMEELFEDLKKK